MFAAAFEVPIGVASPAPAAAQERPTEPTIRLINQPISVGAEDSFAVFVEIDGAPDGSQLVVDIYDRLDSPAALRDPTAAGTMDTFDPLPLADIAPATPQAQGFSIELYQRGDPRPPGAWAYRLDDPGVYPIRIKLRDGDEATIATLVTTLVRRPAADEQVPRTDVAVVATVHQDQPDDAASGAAGSVDGAVDVGLVDGLAAVTGALRARPALAAAFDLTPDTAGRLVAATADDPDAADAVAALRTELGRPGRAVLDAPYVRINATALVAAGLEAEVVRQRDFGRTTLTQLLEPPLVGTWSLADDIDRATLAALHGGGITHVLLDDDAFVGPPPTLPVDLDAGAGPVRALAVDASLAIDQAGGADPVLAAHRLLARLSLISGSGIAGATDGLGGSAPAAPATAVIRLDVRTFDPAVLEIVFNALAYGTPAYRAVPLADAYGPADQSRPAAALVAPRSARLGRYPEVIQAAHASLASYAAMTVDRPDLVGRYQRPLARSAARELSVGRRVDALERIESQLRSRFAAISTSPRDTVTLGARDARFPLTITSRLQYPVRVLVEFEANDRLDFPNDRISATLDEERKVVQVRVRTRASGDTPVRITVRSADGRLVLAESRYTIRSTAVSGVGVMLTIGAAGFLAVWWGRHGYRARRARRRRDADHDGDPRPTPEATPV